MRRLPEGEGGGKPPRFQRFIEIDSTFFKHARLPEVTGGFNGLTADAADPEVGPNQEVGPGVQRGNGAYAA